MGKKLVFVPECPSTNTLALEIAQQSTAAEGTVVVTDHQTAGRGQRGNRWETNPGENLTFSVILKPGFLVASKQFFLNVVICLALKDYLRDKTSDTYIKWPNDILVHRRKISGILIETQSQAGSLHTAVAGIGFNLNQRVFGFPEATSLALATGCTYTPAEELPVLLGHVESRYLALRAGRHGALLDEYLQALYGRAETLTFAADGSEFEGVIEDLDETGRLRIRTAKGLRAFGVKEVAYRR